MASPVGYVPGSPPDPALPRLAVWGRVVALFAIVIALYNIIGASLAPFASDAALELCRAESALACKGQTGWLEAGSAHMQIALYWLPGIISIFALSLLIFPAAIWRQLLGALAGGATTAVMWVLQVAIGITLVEMGFPWGAWLVSGPVAVVASFGSYVTGFVVLLTVLLARRDPEPAAGRLAPTQDPTVTGSTPPGR